MTERYNDIEAIIAKKLAGENTPDDDRILALWVAESAENQQYFDQLKQIWDIAPNVQTPDDTLFDTESALQRVKSQIQFRQRPRKFIWQSAAAAIAVLVVAFWWLFSPNENRGPLEIVSNTATILTDTLPDGSVVTLNRNSGLSIAQGFNAKDRRLALRGEAYFEVAPNKNKPFVVTINELQVKVLGTAFNIDNANIPNKVLVTVAHGKVAVTRDTQLVLLTAGQQAEYDEITHRITQLQNPQNPNTLAYKNKVFRFAATPLRDVIRQLNAAYGVTILLQNPQLETCLLTGDYNNLGISRMLHLIAETFSIKVEHKPDGSYIFSGDGCGE